MSESKARQARGAAQPPEVEVLPAQPAYDPRQDETATEAISPEQENFLLREQIDGLQEQLRRSQHQVSVMEKYAGKLTEQRNKALDEAAQLVANIPG